MSLYTEFTIVFFKLFSIWEMVSDVAFVAGNRTESPNKLDNQKKSEIKVASFSVELAEYSYFWKFGFALKMSSYCCIYSQIVVKTIG